MKQTAVEWLENEVQEIFKEWGGLDTNWLKRFEQAKAMEKEQIRDAYVDGADKGEMFNNENRAFTTDAEQYYQKTFKTE